MRCTDTDCGHVFYLSEADFNFDFDVEDPDGVTFREATDDYTIDVPIAAEVTILCPRCGAEIDGKLSGQTSTVIELDE